VIATVRSEDDVAVAKKAGASEVVRTDGLSRRQIVEQIRALAPDGVHHVVEVAFHANIATDEQVLALGGSVATYASGEPSPAIPFWPLVFKNVALFFLGSDDFPFEAKAGAAAGLNEALEAGWSGFEIAERFPLGDIALAHRFVERPPRPGRVVVTV
jgi:NADPH2:quinone reductase